MIYQIFLFVLPMLTTGNGLAVSPFPEANRDYPYVPSAVTNPATDSADRLNARDVSFLDSQDASYWRADDQDTLKQVLIIHRHGDRTPIELSPKDNLASEPFWAFHGLGQLTNRGKARLHVLGQIMRQRYDQFLSGSVNKLNRKSRASGALRCIESAQVFLASFLALNVPTSPDGKLLVWNSRRADRNLSQVWQPASVNTLASKYDGMLNEGAYCKAIDSEYTALNDSDEFKRIKKEFRHEAQVLKRELDFPLDHFYQWAWASSKLEVEHSYFGLKMRPAVLAIYLRIQEAGDRIMRLFQSRFKMKRLRAGLLMNDIIENMLSMSQSSKSTFNKKFVHYSAHDMNLVFLLGMLDNIDAMRHRPDYAANIAFELHELKGEWFIRLFYMGSVPTKPVELHIEACERDHAGGRCTLTKFSELMEVYRVASWWDWMQECGNSIEGMNPYVENT